MDHRCLYGHRVPGDFAWAIENQVCPVCGAPTVSVTGYQLARELAQEVPLEAMAAFDVVRYLEKGFTLTARDANESGEIEVNEVSSPGASESVQIVAVRPASSAAVVSEDETTVVERVDAPAEPSDDSAAEAEFFAQG